MTNIELQAIQTKIKFDGPSMALCLGIEYDQYRHLYYGHTKIPAHIERAVLELLQIDQEFMADRYAPGGKLDQELAAQYPSGFASAQVEINA